MKNKTIFLVTVLFFATNLACTSQISYRVTFVQDTVFVNSKVLKTNDSFLDTDKMSFKNDHASLKACCSTDGKPVSFWSKNYINSKAKTPKEYQNYIVSLGNRSGENINELQDFLSIPKIGILDTLKIPFQNTEFQVDRNAFFYIRYKYKNKDINKKLISVNDTLLISNYIFELEAIGTIQPDFYPISIYFYNAQNEVSTPLTKNFYPVLMDLPLLKKDLSNIIKHQYFSSEDKLHIIEDYLLMEYSDIYFFESNLTVLINAE